VKLKKTDRFHYTKNCYVLKGNEFDAASSNLTIRTELQLKSLDQKQIRENDFNNFLVL